MSALIHAMHEAEARQITERIRVLVVSTRDQIEQLQRLLTEARDGGAWEALGYASWTAYLADVMGEKPLRLPRDQRQEIVGYLAGEGMSSRAIAPIVGATHSTVQQDVKTRGRNLPPEPEAEPETRPAPQPRTVTGLDGKTYTRPEPPKQQERPADAMSANEADQDRQRQEAQSLSRALITLSAFVHPQARQRYRESWDAQPYSRGLGETYYNPSTIREIAKSLTTFANELKET